MKKTTALLLMLMLLAAAVGAYFFLRSDRAPTGTRGAALVPANALLFAHVPDVSRTRDRWEKTALAAIVREPEVRAFLEGTGWPGQGSGLLERIAAAQPREAVLALTEFSQDDVRGVAAFSYAGKKADVEPLLADLRSRVAQAWPNARRDLEKLRQHEIETITRGNDVLALAQPSGWVLVSRGVEPMREALDRLDGLDETTPSLAASEALAKVVEHMPENYDALLFLQPADLGDRLAQLAAASGQALAPEIVSAIRETQAVGIGARFDGAEARDAIFVLRPGGTAPPPLERRALALTSPETLLFFDWRIGGLRSFDLPSAPAADRAGLTDILGGLRSALEKASLQPVDFARAFGPEAAVIVDWPEGNPQPALLLSLDVRDHVLAERFLEALTGGGAGGTEWVKQERSGALIRVMPQEGLALISPTIVLDDKALVAGLTYDSVEAARSRPAEGAVSAAQLDTATTASGYIDGRRLFTRVYGWLRGYLLISQMLDPQPGQKFDVGKLPPAEAIAPHLGPIIYRQSATTDGILIESHGPITFGQAILVLGSGTVAVFLPMLQDALPTATLSVPPQPSPTAALSPIARTATPPPSAPANNRPTASQSSPFPPRNRPPSVPRPPANRPAPDRTAPAASP